MFSNMDKATDPEVYVEDVYQYSPWTGNGTSQTVTITGLEMDTWGGASFLRSTRGSPTSTAPIVADTHRGSGYYTRLDDTSIDVNDANSISISTDNLGFGNAAIVNTLNATYGSFNFREAPRFFRVATWTGTNGSRTILHGLACAVGAILVVNNTTIANKVMWHRGLTGGRYINFNGSGSQTTTNAALYFGNNTSTVDPDEVEFTVGSNLNLLGDSYTAYCFAHDTSSSGLIYCDSVSVNGSGVGTISIGWQPQMLMEKCRDGGRYVNFLDDVEGFGARDDDRSLTMSDSANDANTDFGFPTGNGVYFKGSPSTTHIYIAVRKGPTRLPSAGTDFFYPTYGLGTGTTKTITSTFKPETVMSYLVDDNGTAVAGNPGFMIHKTSGVTYQTKTVLINSITTYSDEVTQWNKTNIKLGASANGLSNYLNAYYSVNLFGYAKGAYDASPFMGTGNPQTLYHNLGVKPEFAIIQMTNDTGTTLMFAAASSSGNYLDKGFDFNDDDAGSGSGISSVTDTSLVFNNASYWDSNSFNANGVPYILHTFASLSGLSKVGTYAATGSVAVGVTTGFSPRFIMAKSSQATHWYYVDSARGLSGSSDLPVNISRAYIAPAVDCVSTTGSGFTVASYSGSNPNPFNAGGTMYYVALA